ncbi:hypothetical protein ACP4OV_031545 [Aristida adscensionis]
MARVIDSDYVDALSLVGGFDMGINFDGFEENVKKFIELPIKYLDSAHDKAIELIEDVHAMLCPTLPDDKVPNKLNETSKDPTSSSSITGSSPPSVEMELVGANVEVSIPLASPISMGSNSTGCIDTDAHESESCVPESPENTSSKGAHIEVHDPCQSTGATSVTEIYDSCTSEEVILWNPDISIKKLPEEPTTEFQDYVSHALHTDKITKAFGLQCSGHSESSICNGATPLEMFCANNEEQIVAYIANDPVEETKHDVFKFSADPNVLSDDKIQFVNIDVRDYQEHMRSKKFEASAFPQRKNSSFKKMFMRSLSSKLRWSKKQTNAHQAVATRSQDAESLGYQVLSSAGDLEDDWEVL